MENEHKAWLLCEDLLVRIRDEFASEAISILDKEVNSGNIEVNGTVSSAPEQDREYEKKMMVIGNLLKEKEELRLKYAKYMEDNQEDNPKILERIETLKKFLLSIESISILMGYVNEIDAWIKEVSEEVKEKNVSDILGKTLRNSAERKEIMQRVLSKKRFVEEGIITKEEHGQISAAAMLTSSYSQPQE